MESSNPTQEPDKPDHADNKPAHDAAKANPNIAQPPVSVESHSPQPPPCRKQASDSKHKKRDILDHIKLGMEGLGLAFLMAYTIFTYCQLRETQSITKATKESFDLTRNSVKGTEAAILEAVASYTGPLGTFSIQLHNRGKSMARNIHSKFVISRKTLPDLTPIGESQIIMVDAGQLSNDAGFLSTKERYFDVNGFNPERIVTRQETVSVETTFTYENGFGDIVSESVCQQLIAVLNDQTGAYAGASFERCDRIPERLRRFERIEKEFKGKQKQNK